MAILGPLPGIYGNTTIGVDAMIMARPGLRPQDTPRNLFDCRRFGIPAAGYRLLIVPGTGRFALQRFDARQSVTLAVHPSSAILPPGQWNHLELSCSGTTLT